MYKETNKYPFFNQIKTAMNNFIKLFYAMLIGVMSVTFTACGDDNDEPGYDESQPIAGTWIVRNVSNPDYVSYIGGLLPDEEQWKQDFINKWTGKKLSFKASQISDNVVWIEKYDEENPNKTDRSIYYEVSNVNETEMTATYTELVYMKGSGNKMCRTTARFEMKRK